MNKNVPVVRRRVQAETGRLIAFGLPQQPQIRQRKSGHSVTHGDERPISHEDARVFGEPRRPARYAEHRRAARLIIDQTSQAVLRDQMILSLEDDLAIVATHIIDRTEGVAGFIDHLDDATSLFPAPPSRPSAHRRSDGARNAVTRMNSSSSLISRRGSRSAQMG